MNVYLFNERYKDKGGIGKLNEFRALLFTHSYIGNHFGVDRQRVKQWMEELYDKSYDPRKSRREAIVESMIDFAKVHTEQEFRNAFYFTNKEWFLQALSEAHLCGLYGSTAFTEKPHLDEPGLVDNQSNTHV